MHEYDNCRYCGKHFVFRFNRDELFQKSYCDDCKSVHTEKVFKNLAKKMREIDFKGLKNRKKDTNKT